VNVTPRPISLEVGSIVDYAYLLDEMPQPDEHFPCISLPFEGMVTFTSNTSKSVGGRVSWQMQQLGGYLYIRHDAHLSPNMNFSIKIEVDETGRMGGFITSRQVHPDEKTSLNLQCTMIAPALMAIAFLHTKKGVQVTDARPLSRQVRRQMQRKKLPAYTYKVLTVPSVARAVERHNELKSLGIRAHLVRGHWADYRETGICNNPNARGIYWKAPHIRGDKNLGIVDKDYAVAI